MADVIEIELIQWADLRANLSFWQANERFRSMYGEKSQLGKKLHIYHVDLECDTLSAGPAFVQVAKPTNIVKNFTTPMQIYIRSSNAADQGLNVTWIGQKANGDFGDYTFTTNAANGTTAVDCGTWNFIAIPHDADTFAGNLIIDDDGASNEVYWTMALGADATTGIVVIPEGYSGCFLNGKGNLLDVPSNANAANLSKWGSSIEFALNTANANFQVNQPMYAHIKTEQTEILFTAMYEGAAVTAMDTHAYFLIWED